MAVPAFFCISTSAFTGIHGTGIKRIDALLRKRTPGGISSTKRRALEIRETIMKKDFPEVIASEILKKYRALGGGQVAVRSSIVGEDADSNSFAGMMDSFLFVTENSLLESIKRCWASAYSERTLLYRRLRQIKADIRPAVIVQRMVNPDFSGVMFTSDESGSLRINYVKGTSAELLAGKVTGLEIVVDKTAKFAGGPRFVNELINAGTRLERAFGTALDVEWAFSSGKLYVLQARPITSPKETIWDNSNIIESYSGVTTPLTFSVANETYYVVYRQFCKILGVPNDVLVINEPVFRNMIGLIRGRIYYNLTNWYKLLLMLPGIEHSGSFMENMMGIREHFNVENMKSLRKPSYMNRLGIATRVMINWATIDLQVSSFLNRFDMTYRHYSRKDFKRMSANQLAFEFQSMRNALLTSWKAPIVNDFLAMAFYGLLKKICYSWYGDRDGTIYSGLLKTGARVKSADPAKVIRKIAERIKSSEGAMKLFAKPEKRIIQELGANPGYAEIKSLINYFLDEYGYRCTGELKLEEKSYRDEPEKLIRMIKAYSSHKGRQSINYEESNKEEVNKRLLEQPFHRRLIFRFVLAQTRKYLAYRENMRLCRTKSYGILRKIFRAMGANLEARGLLSKSEDVFYLELDELLKSLAEGVDFQQAIKERRRKFTAYRHTSPPPERFVVRHGRFLNLKEKPSHIEQNILRGIGCAPGIAKGTAKLVSSPTARVRDKIIVAESTDPGWVVMFALSRGLVIERGSVLSHSAIIARELGIPAIVNATNATKRIRTGETIEIDGSSGLIRFPARNKR